jgi:Tol biopolymer transport system component
VLVAAAVAVAAEPPRWVRHALGDAVPSTPRAGSSLGSLPAGRLLVSSARGTWIVRGDGTRLRLGPWSAATWSPRGLYVAAWRGRELSAVAPNGRVAWTIAARGTVRDATWSPDGYRIAYRRDAVLAVVAGDGTGARILAQPVRAAAPAWRPGAPHTLAWVGASGRIEVRDVDSGALLWRSSASVGPVTALAWSADGHRLLARGARRVVVFDVTGKRSWRVRLPQDARVGAAAWAPRGDRIALALRGATATSVYVTPAPLVPRHPVFTTTGTLRSLAWSPDGRRLLVRWADADQWLLLSPSATHAPITAIGSISRRFGAPPTVQGWCCG